LVRFDDDKDDDDEEEEEGDEAASTCFDFFCSQPPSVKAPFSSRRWGVRSFSHLSRLATDSLQRVDNFKQMLSHSE